MEPESPWANNPGNIVLRHSDAGRKWFGLVMTLDEHLVIRNEKATHSPTAPSITPTTGQRPKKIDILNLKAEPTVITALVGQPGFAPAYHMNKTHWITVLLDGTVDFAQIEELIDTSYELTAAHPRVARKTHKMLKNG